MDLLDVQLDEHGYGSIRFSTLVPAWEFSGFYHSEGMHKAHAILAARGAGAGSFGCSAAAAFCVTPGMARQAVELSPVDFGAELELELEEAIGAYDPGYQLGDAGGAGGVGPEPTPRGTPRGTVTAGAG